MALTYQVIGSAAEDMTFVQRVRGYIGIAGASVFSESAGTQNHAARLEWATAVVAEPERWATRTAPFVAGQNAGIGGTTLASITDGNIQTAVDSLINYFASLVT